MALGPCASALPVMEGLASLMSSTTAPTVAKSWIGVRYMIEITEKDPQKVPLDDEYTAMLETQGEEATKAFYICNAFKYLHRQKRKGGVADIKKAKWCLEKYLELAE